MPPCRLALLIRAHDQPGWVFDLIEWLLGSPRFDLVLVLVAGGGAATKGRLALRALAGMERHALSSRQRRLLTPRRLTGSACRAPVIGWPEKNVESLLGLGLDLIVAPDGLPVPRADLAGIATSGALCLSHGADPGCAGGCAGFREVLDRADHTAVWLWRIAAPPEDDELIERRGFNTEVAWRKNQARAFDIGRLMLSDALAHYAATGECPPAGPVPHIDTSPPRQPPTLGDGAAYLGKQARLTARRVLRRLSGRNVRWRVGLLPAFGSCAVAADALQLMPPKGRFYADPFVHVRDGRPYIFFEDYGFKERKGRIAVATYRDGRFELLGTALDLPHHLSFPYVFEYEGELHMIPESCACRRIELWRCVDFPLKWELRQVLMAEVSAVDTVVFKHGRYWWLFTNIDRTGGQSHCDELFAFYASSPASADWTPHPANPIVRDPAKARNAGLVISPRGEVIRCAQYQGFCWYGKGLSLNRIEKLNTDEYGETDGPIQYAKFLRGDRLSMHHWHSEGGPAVFDFGYTE